MGTKLTESFLKKLIPYIVASCLALLSAFLLLKLWLADWRIQFFYTGDAMFYNMMVKGIIENGWYLYNKNLGMPFGATLYDFPAPDTFTFLLFKFLAIFTSDQSLIINIFYIATFPLTTITSLYVLRHFKISFFPALLSSLLYAFLTYHLSRAEIHLMYTVYFIVPLIVMVILWVCAAGSKKDNDEGEQLRLSLKNRKFISSLVICALIASTGGVYYSFFACFLLVAVGIIQASAYRQLRKLLLPGVLTAFTFLVLVANLSPNIIYQMKNGKTETAQRNPIEAEIYGLKLAQLVLPQTGHRWITFRRPKAKYNFAPLVNENDDATLGVIGTIGFMTLLGWLACNVFNKGREENQTQILLGQLSVLNITAFLLGTIGGFSVIFALFVSPQIRSYNRISIYIAFFSLFAV
ncbi:MAG: hypothetical protein J2P31_16030, partial [Blastocatellia bacterium]|nr:hypothetical protein [Blastocatellia bacterium]